MPGASGSYRNTDSYPSLTGYGQYGNNPMPGYGNQYGNNAMNNPMPYGNQYGNNALPYGNQYGNNPMSFGNQYGNNAMPYGNQYGNNAMSYGNIGFPSQGTSQYGSGISPLNIATPRIGNSAIMGFPQLKKR